MTDNPQITETLYLKDLKTVALCEQALDQLRTYMRTLSQQTEALSSDDLLNNTDKAQAIAIGRNRVRKLKALVESRYNTLLKTEQASQPISLAGDILRTLKRVDHEAYLQVIVALHSKYPNISRIA